MSSKIEAAILDAVTGTTLISLGFVGVLVRLGVLDLSQAPRWVAFEQWWPMLLIIAGLVVWLGDMDHHAQSLETRRTLEMPYGK